MKYLSYDTETTGLNPYDDAEMFAFSTADEDATIRVCRLDGKDKRPKTAKKYLWQLWSDKSIAKVMHNAKFDLSFTEKYFGRRLAEDHQFHDTQIQSHLLQNDHVNHRLKQLAWELAGVPVDDEAAIKPYTTGEFENFSTVPVHLMNEYQKRDAERTMLLHLFFWPKIKNDPKLKETYDTEIDLVRTTLRLEERGVMIHQKNCRNLIAKLNRDCESVLQEGEDLFGKRINFGNDNHVRKLFYHDLKFPKLKLTPKGTGISVDKETLAGLRAEHPHPVLEMVLKYRSWRRGITILKGYLNLCDKKGIVHPNLRTNGARTGRESCSKPNLQNVAKEEVLLNPYPIPARRAFCPRPGFINFHLDYSGIEFRIAIHYTNDERLFQLVRKGEDLHAIGARILYGDRWINATKEQRKILRNSGKNANFAKMYGASMQKVSHTLGHSINKKVFREYNEIFGSLDVSAKCLTQTARHNMLAHTLFGRHLRVAKAYVAVNYTIQGSAAEILKRAQNRVHHYLEESTGGEVGLILPIHDELVIEYPVKRLADAPEIIKGIRKRMVDFPQLNIPLDVDVEYTSTDWAHKKGYKYGSR